MIKKFIVIHITMISCTAIASEPKLNELLKADKVSQDEQEAQQKKLAQKKDEPASFAALNNNSHTIIIGNNDKKCQCAALYGWNLIACMKCLSSEDLKKNFKQLSVRAAVFYLLNIGIDDYKEFLNYWSEEEWTDYWQQLNIRDQHVMPRTIQIQKDVIEQSYKNATDNSTIVWWYHYYYVRSETYGTERWWKQLDHYRVIPFGNDSILANEHRKLKKELYKLSN